MPPKRSSSAVTGRLNNAGARKRRAVPLPVSTPSVESSSEDEYRQRNDDGYGYSSDEDQRECNAFFDAINYPECFPEPHPFGQPEDEIEALELEREEMAERERAAAANKSASKAKSVKPTAPTAPTAPRAPTVNPSDKGTRSSGLDRLLLNFTTKCKISRQNYKTLRDLLQYSQRCEADIIRNLPDDLPTLRKRVQ